jgi:ATP dependent DNA ligase domain
MRHSKTCALCDYLAVPLLRRSRRADCRPFWPPDGRPIFNDLLFRRRDPVYVAFDVLNVEGADVRGIPFKDRRAILIRTAERHGMEKSELFFGCGKAMFRAVCDHDLEGIIAKKLDDPYEPERTRWWKILNAEYSQKEGRSELFERRYA